MENIYDKELNQIINDINIKLHISENNNNELLYNESSENNIEECIEECIEENNNIEESREENNNIEECIEENKIDDDRYKKLFDVIIDENNSTKINNIDNINKKKNNCIIS
jgi:lysyl-tRNA synthetase class I